MRVRALRPHQNACGDKAAKAKGEEYECSESTASSLIETGMVEAAAKAVSTASRTSRRSGTKTAARAKAAKPGA